MSKIITLLLFLFLSLSATAQIKTFIEGDPNQIIDGETKILPGECDWITGYPNSTSQFYGWLRAVLAIDAAEYEIGDTIKICHSVLNWGGLPYHLIWHLKVSIYQDNVLLWQKIPFPPDTLVFSFGQGIRYEDIFDSTAFLGPGTFLLGVTLTSLAEELVIPFVVTDIIPVELTSFTVEVRVDRIYLQWSTATELNNLGWEIERSTDLLDWQKIGFVAGKGSSSSPETYQFVDYDLPDGDRYYYRMKQVDYDNSYKYSETIVVKVSPKSFVLRQNYPNPFNSQTQISFILPRPTHVRLDIYNLLGNKVISLVNEIRPQGFHKVNFNASDLPSGVYFYVLQAGTEIAKKKMILVK